MSEKTDSNGCCLDAIKSGDSPLASEPFLKLLDDAPVGIFRCSIHGKLYYANRTLLNIFGYRSLAHLSDIVKSFAAVFQDSHEWERISGQLLTGQEIQGFRARCRRRTGASLILDVWAHSVKGRDGLPCCFQGLVEDVTQRVLATDALAVCEERYQDLFNSIPLGILQVARDGTLLSANPAVARVLGYESVEELHEKVPNTRTLFPNPEVRERLILQNIEKPAPYNIETALLRKDGTPFIAGMRGRFVRDDSGEVVRIEGYVEDISATVRTRMKLIESERRYRSLAESIQEGVWEVDEGLRYTYVSPRFCKMLGYSREELLGKTPFQMMAKEEAEKVRMLFEPILAARKPFAFLENLNLRKDGTSILLETSGAPFLNEEGQFSGYRGIDRDVTARKQAEMKHEKREALLKRQVASLTRDLERAEIDLQKERQQRSIHRDAMESMNRELMEANRTLTVMAKRIEQSREEVMAQISLDIRAKILPLVTALVHESAGFRPELKMLETYLLDFCAPPEAHVDFLDNVTPAELRVASLIRDGLSSKDIAQHLNVSLATVKSHRKNLRKKLNLKDNQVDLRKFLQAKLA